MTLDRNIARANAALLLLAALPLVVAHGDEMSSMDMSPASSAAPTNTPAAAEEIVPNFFRHPHYGGWMYAHIALMVVAWTVVLPPALMLSVARSRYHLPAQVIFHIVNGAGFFTGFVYRRATPDLYKNNSHNAIGWVATSFTVAWTLTSLFSAYSAYKSRHLRSPKRKTPLSSRAMAFHNRIEPYSDRFSRDSGHGTDRNSASLYGSRHNSRQNSADSINHKTEGLLSSGSDDEHGNDDFDSNDAEQRGFLGNNRVDRFVSRNVGRIASQRVSRVVRFTQIVLEKLVLLIGFVAITTGFVVWGGVFMGQQVFSGLAHFIKGGIFFWYGLLTLGRWMGAFTEFGWAWNIRPEHPVVARWKTRIPSAEFTESFVIWLYGASNVFLEHLNAWGKAWTAQDLEHVSITLLFFGGGMLGMLIESRWARDLANTTVSMQQQQWSDEEASDSEASSARFGVGERNQPWAPPKSYRTSLNPLPGLVILLLGLMMSSHHQSSMVSTMMHGQWGKLLCGFALARAATYLILFLSPPASRFPARPPSELVAAFCLVAGGIMFMLSARDTVVTIETNGLDAMAVFTVTMGLSAAIMAWEIVCYALKGWAVRKERAAAAM